MARSETWVGLAAVLLAACGPLYEIQTRYLYQPPQHELAVAEIEGLERWWREVDGVRVEAWYLPPLRAPEGPGPAVIFAHGNAERIDDWPERLRPYREMGLAVLLPEYRGYGRSGGAPSERAIVDDFAHFYDRLADRSDVDSRLVVLHGRSLGGGVVGTLSERRPVAALVLESTFTSVPDLASHWMVPAAALRDRFDTRAVLQGSDTPTLIFHGTRDTLIPIRHAVELDRVAWDSHLVTFDADHNDMPRTATYWRLIREHFEENGVPTVSAR